MNKGIITYHNPWPHTTPISSIHRYVIYICSCRAINEDADLPTGSQYRMITKLDVLTHCHPVTHNRIINLGRHWFGQYLVVPALIAIHGVNMGPIWGRQDPWALLSGMLLLKLGVTDLSKLAYLKFHIYVFISKLSFTILPVTIVWVCSDFINLVYWPSCT